MPTKPARPCRWPRCPQLTLDRSGYCAAHLKAARAQHDAQRGTAAQRGYGARWQRAGKAYLREHPLCEICLKKNPPVIEPATLVDHIIPHRGDPVLFWDPGNWESASEHCHNEKTAREDGAFGNQPR